MELLLLETGTLEVLGVKNLFHSIHGAVLSAIDEVAGEAAD